jgi:hypothetical protein
MPKIGSASFNGFVDGLWSDGTTTRRLYGSTAALTANFATGSLLTTLTLIGRDDTFGNFLDSAPVPLGTFTGSGLIAGGTNGFDGTLIGPNGWAGGFYGGFNGPGASEYGYIFGLAGANDAAAAGVAVGKRN